MTLKDNFFYWQISLENPEPVQDKYYIFDELIIEDKDLIRKVERLRELIISYCVLLEKKSKVIEDIFKEIYSIIISIDKIQYHEFIAFWKVLDLSYSVFKKLPNKKDILKEILIEYCRRRRRHYDRIGYSNVTVQALYDVGTSRKKGSAANYKIIDMIKTNFHNSIHAKNFHELKSNNIAYCLPDRGDKTLFEVFCKKYNIKYEFGKQHQGKVLDFVLKIGKNIFLIEAKHMKEGGGAQNKQIVEIIDFIKYQEASDNIHYVTFLDGVYFNKFSKTYIQSSKIKRQKDDIIKNLERNKNNFFVNTIGLKSLFQDLEHENTPDGFNNFI